LADVLKLVFKEIEPKFSSNKNFFFFGPFGSLLIIVLRWVNITLSYSSVNWIFGVVIIFCLASFKIYILLVVRWGGNSKYGFLGGLRGCAQVISYEISFFFLIFSPLIYYRSYNLQELQWKFLIGVLVCPCIIGMWVFRCLAETKRAPFDFAEGERELVSGFNVEYGSLQFGFLYVGEYGRIILLSCLRSCLFFNLGLLWIICLTLFFMVCFLWIRGSLPRFRYDLMMEVA